MKKVLSTILLAVSILSVPVSAAISEGWQAADNHGAIVTDHSGKTIAAVTCVTLNGKHTSTLSIATGNTDSTAHAEIAGHPVTAVYDNGNLTLSVKDVTWVLRRLFMQDVVAKVWSGNSLVTYTLPSKNTETTLFHATQNCRKENLK